MKLLLMIFHSLLQNERQIAKVIKIIFITWYEWYRRKWQTSICDEMKKERKTRTTVITKQTKIPYKNSHHQYMRVKNPVYWLVSCRFCAVSMLKIVNFFFISIECLLVSVSQLGLCQMIEIDKWSLLTWFGQPIHVRPFIRTRKKKETVHKCLIISFHSQKIAKRKCQFPLSYHWLKIFFTQ